MNAKPYRTSIDRRGNESLWMLNMKDRKSSRMGAVTNDNYLINHT